MAYIIKSTFIENNGTERCWYYQYLFAGLANHMTTNKNEAKKFASLEDAKQVVKMQFRNRPHITIENIK